MPIKPVQAIKIFYCYAHEDKELRVELEKHLAALKRLGQITGWYDREIQAGTEWEREIDTQLNISNIILLLVSSDFISSDYCYSVEMQKAIKMHQAGHARVIPIILRPVDWQGTPLATLQMLPTGAKPVTRWIDRDEAFEDVAKNIRLIVNALLTSKNKDQNPSDDVPITFDRATPPPPRLAKGIEVGRIYTCLVCRLTDIAVLVEILPGIEGLIHTSQLADYLVRHPEDVVSVGDEIIAMAIEIDQQSRIHLSRKAALRGELPSATELRNYRQDWRNYSNLSAGTTRQNSLHSLHTQTIKINPDKINSIIEPAIHQIQEESGAEIEIEDDGSIHILAASHEEMQIAIDIIRDLTREVEEVEVGGIYTATVRRLVDFGAFVEILSGREGLIRTSQLADYQVIRPEDVVSVGDEITVMVIEVDQQGRINLSRRAALNGKLPSAAEMERDRREYGGYGDRSAPHQYEGPLSNKSPNFRNNSGFRRRPDRRW